MSRVHAADGKLIREFSREYRIFIPIEDIPENTIIFNTEQIESITENWKKKILNLARKNIIFWDYSQYNLDYLSKTINIKGKLFQIGYQKELNRINHNIDKNIDVLFPVFFVCQLPLKNVLAINTKKINYNIFIFIRFIGHNLITRCISFKLWTVLSF